MYMSKNSVLRQRKVEFSRSLKLHPTRQLREHFYNVSREPGTGAESWVGAAVLTERRCASPGEVKQLVYSHPAS